MVKNILNNSTCLLFRKRRRLLLMVAMMIPELSKINNDFSLFSDTKKLQKWTSQMKIYLIL